VRFFILVTVCTPGVSWNSTGVTVAGITGVQGANSTLLTYTNDVGVDIYSNIYVADTDNQRIQRFSSNSSVGQTVAGVVGVIGTTSNMFNYPRGIFVGGSTLFVSDFYNYRIQRYTYNAPTAVTAAGGNAEVVIRALYSVFIRSLGKERARNGFFGYGVEVSKN
jgi:hypothetical protein